MITRRQFVTSICLLPYALRLETGSAAERGPTPESSRGPSPGPSITEARYYRKASVPKNGAECRLCPRECVVPDGELGFCRARKNTKGTLYALGYAAPCAIHVDPIEKKPFYHVHPRSTSFSIASAGCNLRCRFCQNWQISQVSPLETTNHFLPPEEVVEMALKSGSESIAYTYTEPTNFFEYMIDVAALARKRGLLNVYHSNGYINPEPLKELTAYLDAADIDLKGFTESFYHTLCDAKLKPVLETLKILKEKGVWIEITNLVIPGQNDDVATIADMCTWIRRDLGPDVPVHFSRFFPMYKMTNISPTPVSTVERAREIAMKAGLHYAYTGNIPGHAGESTYCPGCKKVVIKRVGYSIQANEVKNGKCKFCGVPIKGIWSA